MDNYSDVWALNRDERQLVNLETYRRFVSRGKDCLECIDDEDAKAIKEAVKGLGKVEAVVNGRRSLAGNNKYVLFVKSQDGYKVYLFTVLNGLYNEMGPYVDLNTAMSNADCYGLFEECKKVASNKILENKDMNNKLFESIYEDDDEMLGYDEITDGEMEDFDYDQMDDDFVGPTPASDHYNDLADSFPISDPEFQDDEGNYDEFNYTQMGDGPAVAGTRTKHAAYADALAGGDNAVAFDDEDGIGTPIGGHFGQGLDDEDFAMSDDADLDRWARS